MTEEARVAEAKKTIQPKSVFNVLFMSVIGVVAGGLMAFILGGTLGIVVGLTLAIAGYIYPLVIWSKMVKEINLMCADDGEHLMPYLAAMLLGLITFGIYPLYYYYRIQTRLHENADRYNVKISETGGRILLWYLLSLITFGICALIAMAIVIRSFNKLAFGYNRTLEQTAAGSGKILYKAGVPEDTLVGAIIQLANQESVTVGRDAASAELVVQDKKVSRRHCRIQYDGPSDSYLVTDYSRNGTKVDGRRLEGNVMTRVNAGSVLQLSDVTQLQLG